MAALSPATLPSRDTLRGVARATRDGGGRAGRSGADGSSCVVAVASHDRIRNGKREVVAGYTRSNPFCDRSDDSAVIPVNERGGVPPGFGQRLPSPRDPVGRLRGPIEIAPGTNPPANIRGRPYSGHALDRMQGRGISPSAIENAVRPENFVRSSKGADIYWDAANKLMVVVDPRTNTVITAMPRNVGPRR